MRGVPLAPSVITRTLVCVDRSEHSDFSGAIFNPYMKEPVVFESVYVMMMTMDRFFDKHSFPHAHFENRTFTTKIPPVVEKSMEREVQKYMSDDIFKTERGKKATFIVQVQFRQNASWQGEITWMDEKKTQRFRSVLEMLKLMGNALEDESVDLSATWN